VVREFSKTVIAERGVRYGQVSFVPVSIEAESHAHAGPRHAHGHSHQHSHPKD
jgi:CopG family transcriptional regulator, nickel-responsive regulator